MEVSAVEISSSFPSVLPFRENILVLDIFFEALNYETIEQKKAYELAGLLGERHFPRCQEMISQASE